MEWNGGMERWNGMEWPHLPITLWQLIPTAFVTFNQETAASSSSIRSYLTVSYINNMDWPSKVNTGQYKHGTSHCTTTIRVYSKQSEDYTIVYSGWSSLYGFFASFKNVVLALWQWIKIHHRLQGCKSKWGTSTKKDSSYNAPVSLNFSSELTH